MLPVSNDPARVAYIETRRLADKRRKAELKRAVGAVFCERCNRTEGQLVKVENGRYQHAPNCKAALLRYTTNRTVEELRAATNLGQNAKADSFWTKLRKLLRG